MLRKILPLTLLSALLFGSACSVKPEKVLEEVVGAMCKRVVVCQPGLMPNEEECRKTMKAALDSSKENLKVEASRKKLDACLDSIAKVDCPNLLGTEPPAGCEFLK
ncbi:MAG TPA: hypothetical protein VFW62_06380 [bacterium]|nr:hypothetical protein [bacterium]HKY62530.1 hypothetical protein [bacterium]